MPYGLGIAKGMLVTLRNLIRKPVTVQYPTEPFLICRSITVSIAANTEATSFFDSPVFSEMSAIIWVFVIAAFNPLALAITASS